VKQSDSALLKAGFKTVYNGKDDDEQPIVTSSKETQWVQVSTYTYNQYTAYVLSTLKAEEQDQAPSSDSLAEEITKSGRVTLAGLQFQADKAELPADAEKVMSGVAALLARQPDWKIRVEAHGSETGAAQQRASAVATWLVDHGVDKTRVSVLGVPEGEPKIELVRF
jgi:outer membrane protein OmpA-like peptidoglycan-associated protein